MLAHLWVISSIISSPLTTRCHRSLLERGIYTVLTSLTLINRFNSWTNLSFGTTFAQVKRSTRWFVIAIVHYDFILSIPFSAFHG